LFQPPKDIRGSTQPFRAEWETDTTFSQFYSLSSAGSRSILAAMIKSCSDRPPTVSAAAALLAIRAIANVALSHFVRHFIMKLLVWNPGARCPFEMKGWACIRSFDLTGIEFTSLGCLYYPARQQTKKADVAEHPEVFDHVGLLVNEPSSSAGLPFI
jgi:hypothetical protein